jgi:hypothetical protein
LNRFSGDRAPELQGNVPNDFPENAGVEKHPQQAGNPYNTLKNKTLYSLLTRAVPMRGSGIM